MTLPEAIILRAAAVWTVWIWGTRITNILQSPDHSSAFKAVHTALALVSVVFAAAIWIVAGRNRRRLRRTSGSPESRSGAAEPAPAGLDEGGRPV